MSTAPVRIQLKRVKGWRMPPNTIHVARGSRWGNPYKVGDMPHNGDNGQTLAEALWAYEHLFLIDRDLSSLRGKNLACWCKPGAPCHADVLLNIANQ